MFRLVLTFFVFASDGALVHVQEDVAVWTSRSLTCAEAYRRVLPKFSIRFPGYQLKWQKCDGHSDFILEAGVH